jgi:hypothetical protein
MESVSNKTIQHTERNAKRYAKKKAKRALIRNLRMEAELKAVEDELFCLEKETDPFLLNTIDQLLEMIPTHRFKEHVVKNDPEDLFTIDCVVRTYRKRDSTIPNIMLACAIELTGYEPLTVPIDRMLDVKAYMEAYGMQKGIDLNHVTYVIILRIPNEQVKPFGNHIRQELKEKHHCLVVFWHTVLTCADERIQRAFASQKEHASQQVVFTCIERF